MASSKRKARVPIKKKRTTKRTSRTDIRSSVGSTRRKRTKSPHRQQSYDSVSIPQLVYKLLTIDKYNQETKRFSFPEFSRTPRRRMQSYHDGRRYPYDTVGYRDSRESIQVPEYAMESSPASIKGMTEAMNAANSSDRTSSANSSVSNISVEPITLANSLNGARALFKKKSLVQLINNYIKAGIEEGKRQAKKYIRKALSFGVRSGYLIPADQQGNVLRVCPTLDVGFWSSRRSDAESRQRRRIARRGEAHPTTINDRKAMRRGISPSRSRREVNNTQVMSRRRYRMHPSQHPNRDSNTREEKHNTKRSSDELTLRERNKSETIAKRKSKIIDDKQRKQRKRGDAVNVKKSVKRRRTIISPKRSENNYEPVEENGNDMNNQYKGDEDNHTQASNREDGSEIEKQMIETKINEDYNRLGCRNADDNDGGVDERSEGTSIEHIVMGTIREMDT